MPTMNVSLTAEIVEFVESQVANGDYVSASEVVRDALRVMRHDRQNEALKLKLLRDEIERGYQDTEANRFSGRSVAEIAQSVLDESDD
jgi:antitoxin ParD1/3/4